MFGDHIQHSWDACRSQIYEFHLLSKDMFPDKVLYKLDVDIVPLNEFDHLERVNFRVHIQHRYAVGQINIHEFLQLVQLVF